MTERAQQINAARPWLPVPLRTWFWGSLVAFLVGTAIGLEVALHFAIKNNGVIKVSQLPI